jgi:hypothetical protein
MGLVVRGHHERRILRATEANGSQHEGLARDILNPDVAVRWEWPVAEWARDGETAILVESLAVRPDEYSLLRRMIAKVAAFDRQGR